LIGTYSDELKANSPDDRLDDLEQLFEIEMRR
jgi:hypothetical protein